MGSKAGPDAGLVFSQNKDASARAIRAHTPSCQIGLEARASQDISGSIGHTLGNMRWQIRHDGCSPNLPQRTALGYGQRGGGVGYVVRV